MIFNGKIVCFSVGYTKNVNCHPYAIGELYHEQYNEHGVRIEKELSDNDLIQKYLG
jgi:hypothetical protein